MTERDTTTNGRRRPWWRRGFAYVITGLSLIGQLNVLLCGHLVDRGGEDAATGTSARAPRGLPGHPERLAAHVPLSATEVLLWRDLGWVASPPHSAGS